MGVGQQAAAAEQLVVEHRQVAGDRLEVVAGRHVDHLGERRRSRRGRARRSRGRAARPGRRCPAAAADTAIVRSSVVLPEPPAPNTSQPPLSSRSTSAGYWSWRSGASIIPTAIDPPRIPVCRLGRGSPSTSSIVTSSGSTSRHGRIGSGSVERVRPPRRWRRAPRRDGSSCACPVAGPPRTDRRGRRRCLRRVVGVHERRDEHRLHRLLRRSAAPRRTHSGTRRSALGPSRA